MPTYTLGEMMSAVTTNCGRRADIDPSDVSRIVNEAYFEVAFTTEPEGMERIAVSSTTTGENKISLPTDFLEPISATLIYQPSWSTSSSAYSSYVTLTPISVADMDAKNPQPSGVPQEVAFYNTWLELWPSPNSAYSLQLRYRSGVTDLIEPNQVPSLATPWRLAVVKKAEEKLYDFLQDPMMAQVANTRYLQYVSQLKTDQARRQSGQMRHHVTPQYGRYGGRRRA